MLRARKAARTFARQLSDRLAVEPVKTQATYNGWMLLVDDVLIEVVVRHFRIFDGIHVWHQGAEVWLPVLQRLKLRRTIRLLVIERALG